MRGKTVRASLPERCLEETEAVAFATGRASRDLQLAAERHIDRCSACLEWVAAMGNAPSTPSQRALAVTVAMQPSDEGARSRVARPALATKSSPKSALAAWGSSTAHTT
jgi:hypothetical protein